MRRLKRCDIMYGEFARVYDKLQDVDYGEFVSFYKKAFEKFGINPKLVLDLGCGTGNITVPMSENGYEMIGVDISSEMLDIASNKARDKQLDILFLNQDMTEFELYGTVDAAVCALDGVNYLTEDGELIKLFELIQNYLNPSGIFIFDLNTEHKLKNIIGDNTFVYDEDGIYCVWDSEYDEDARICEFNLDFFIKQDNGLYKKGEEYQTERAYSEKEICETAEKAGLSVLGIFDGLSFSNAKKDSERITVVLRKNA